MEHEDVEAIDHTSAQRGLYEEINELYKRKKGEPTIASSLPHHNPLWFYHPANQSIYAVILLTIHLLYLNQFKLNPYLS